jgi:hypothetical protein
MDGKRIPKQSFLIHKEEEEIQGVQARDGKLEPVQEDSLCPKEKKKEMMILKIFTGIDLRKG